MKPPVALILVGCALFSGLASRRATAEETKAGPTAVSLDARTLQSMVIVEGEHGRGSGFLTRMGEHIYVVTNSHVIRGQAMLKFRDMSNRELSVGPLQIADSQDLVRGEVTSASIYLQVASKVETQVKIGDDVIVAGNSEGAGVVRALPGKVVGIGPDRIEVDANFVPGNSGSPILQKSTGEVIGVATYLKIPPALRNGAKSGASSLPVVTQLNEVRRFGYRIDTVGHWIIPPHSEHLLREGVKLDQLDQTQEVLRAVIFDGPMALKRRGASSFISKEQIVNNPGLAALHTFLETFIKQYSAATNDEQRQAAMEAFFNSVKGVTATETAGILPEHFSGYFATLYRKHLDNVKDLNAFHLPWRRPRGLVAR